MDNSLIHWRARGLNEICLRQIFILDPVVVKTQNCLARMEAS